MLQAAAKLLPECPEVEFILAGKDTPNTETDTTYRAAFEKEFAGQGPIKDRVKFTGAISEAELHQLYANCDIFCLPSRYESFGLVLVEAMVFGKPVVGVDIGGMPEIVTAGKNGFLAQPENADSLADCLRRLIRSQSLRREFGACSRQLFEEKFDLPKVVARTVAKYRQVAEADADDCLTAVNRITPGMKKGLAEVVATTTGKTPEASERIATALLDVRCYPVDYLAGLRRLSWLPNEAFITEMFSLLLGREVDGPAYRHYLECLSSGVARYHIVRHVTMSEEAYRVRLPTFWLDDLQLVLPLTGKPLAAGRVLRKIRSLLRRLKAALPARARAWMPKLELPPQQPNESLWLRLLCGGCTAGRACSPWESCGNSSSAGCGCRGIFPRCTIPSTTSMR